MASATTRPMMSVVVAGRSMIDCLGDSPLVDISKVLVDESAVFDEDTRYHLYHLGLQLQRAPHCTLSSLFDTLACCCLI